MPEQHPSEVTLLSYVEDELAPDTRQDVSEHLVACRECADQVRKLEAGRAALRSAPALELSEERRARLYAELPDRRPRRSFSDYVRRGFLIAAPVAVAAGLAAVVFTTDPQFGGGDQGDEGAAIAEDAGQDAGGGQEMEQSTGAADATAPLSARAFVRNVAGPASAVVTALAAEGIESEIEDGSVVAEGTTADVRAALQGRPSGIVAVYVR